MNWRAPLTFSRAMWHAWLYFIHRKPLIAPKSIQQWRRSVCDGCPQNSNAMWPACGACGGCFIVPKVMLSSESCPLDKWLSLDPSNKNADSQSPSQ